MTGLVVLAAVFVFYALVASRLARVSVSAPMVFVLAGILLGPSGIDVLHVELSGEAGKILAELTLAVLLFTDASTIPLRTVEQDRGVPGRLLGIGLPLTIGLGTIVARWLFPAQGWAMAALIAAILAPTDIALGLTVVTNRAVPVRIRRALNVESGLNDGIATPFVTLFLLIVVAEESVGAADWAVEAVRELGLALVVGVAVGVVAGRAAAAARRRGWTSPASEDLVVLALAMLSYGASASIGGNGFVAAFVGGIVFGSASKRGLTEGTEFAENVGLFSSFLVWALFGAFLAGPTLSDGFEGAAIAYALLSLTAVRMAPVALALLGTKWRADTVAFVGWFGPRGLASVVFLLVAVEDLHETAMAAPVAPVTWTILFSIALHGLSAGPLARAYGDRISGASRDAQELAEAPELRVRRRDLSHPDTQRASHPSADAP